MVIKLEDIFRDAMSSYPGGFADFDSIQVTNWINEAYVSMRNELIQVGRHEQFAVEVSVTGFQETREIPYLKQHTLKQMVCQSFPLKEMVVYAVGHIHRRLTAAAKAYDKGDRVYQGTDLYQAVTDVPAIDSSNLKFVRKDVRSYYPANGIKYQTGDVVFENESAYRATQSITATSSDTLASQPEWEQVYWKRIGMGFKDPEILDFGKVDRKKNVIDAGGVVLSINRDTLYVSGNVRSMHLKYIPEHTYLRKMSSEFIIPDTALNRWRQLIHQKMLQSKGHIAGDTDES